MNHIIPFERFQKAREFYSSEGYTEVDLSWTASAGAISLTKPPHAKNFLLDKFDFLVGSGEQSFLDMLNRNELVPNRRYFGTTPCFRDDVEDELHSRYFLKTELFIPLPYSEENERKISISLSFMMYDALRFLEKVSNIGTVIRSIKEYDGHSSQLDIVTEKKGIELGSYGYRRVDKLKMAWMYGTGLAEPRLTAAEKMENEA